MHWSPRRARGLSRLQARAIRSAAAIALVFLPLALVSGPAFNAEATPSGARSLLASFTVSSNGIDANALNLGVRMTATQAVTITRIRFYKLAESNGTHTAHVWAANGSLIATEAFTGETASGWQEVTLSSPVVIASGAEFTVGYFTSAGHYPRGSFDVSTGTPFSGVNGAYQYSAVDGAYPPNNQGTNYGIDFDYAGGVPDPPTAVSAVAGDASATVNWAAPASDGESAVTGYTVTSTPAGAVCAVTVASRTAACTGLTNNRYTSFTVKATSSAGDSSSSSASNTVVPVATSSQPSGTNSLYRSWVPGATSSPSGSGHGENLTLGLKVHASQSGSVTAIRYFRPYGDLGTRTVSLWSIDGTPLATAAALSESSSGWQQVSIPSTSIDAGQDFVVGFTLFDGEWAYRTPFASVTSGPISSIEPRYDYGTGASAFPGNSSPHNYGIDLLFEAASAPSPPRAVTATAGNATATVTWLAPFVNGGAAITGYTVTASGTGGTCSTLVAVTPNPLSCTFRSLSNGTPYSFTAVATNAVGDSAASGVSSPVTPVAPLSSGASQPDPVPTPTPSPSPSPTPSETPTPVLDEVPTPEPTPSPTRSTALLAAPSASPSGSALASASASAPASASPSASASSSETAIADPRDLPSPSPGPAPADVAPATSPALDPVVAAAEFAAAADAPPAPVAVPAGGLFGGDEGGPDLAVDLGLDVGSKAAGAPVTVAASGLLPNSPVQIIVYSDPQILATVQTDDAGNANVTAEIPSDLPEGAHTLVVQAIGAEGTPVQSMGAMQLNDEGVVTAVAPPADATGLAPGDEAMTRALAAGKPVYDAQGHPVTVAAVAAAGAAVVAVAGAAGAAAAGASGAAGGGHAGGGSSGGGSSGTHGRADGADGADGSHGGHGHVFRQRGLLGVGAIATRVGDRSMTWRLPLTTRSDGFIAALASRSSRVSFILPRCLNDGLWARAIFGSGANLLWFTGIALGLVSLVKGGFQVFPSSTLILLVIMALGILDSMAGLLAWATMFLGALVSGHLSSLADLRTTVGIALIAITLSMLANYMRPLRRARGEGLVYLFDRIADYSIPPVVIAFGAAGMVKALNGLSGLELIADSDIPAIEVVAGLAIVARLVLEDVAVHLYPARCAELALPDLAPPSTPLRLMAIAARTAITLLVLSAFTGLSWPAFIIAALLSVPLVLRVWIHRIPNTANVHQWTPRGVLKLTIITVTGLLVAGWIFASEERSALLPGILVLLLVPSALWSIVDVFGRSGGEWRNIWPKRVLGIAVWCLCAGLLTGVIVLGH